VTDPSITADPAAARRPGDHERSDISVTAIVWAGIFLTATVVLMGLLTFALYRYFALRDVPGSPPPTLESILPAEPRLQSDPAAEMEALRQEEERLVNSYRWMDQKRGIARIPVTRAMELLVERGLPVRSEAPASGAPDAPAPAGEPPAASSTPDAAPGGAR
jgi:hypothetical protein